MHRSLTLIAAAGFALQPLGASAGELLAALDEPAILLAAVSDTGLQSAGALPADARGTSEDGAARRVGADPSRSQALARALLLMMTGGGGSRPFPLIPQ